MKAYLKVLIAFITNNWHGKREDVHGRTYRSVVKRFGIRVMVHEYRTENSWLIK